MRVMTEKVKKDFKDKNYILKTGILIFLLISLIFISFTIGRYQFTLKTLLDIFISCFIGIGEYWKRTLEVVILQVRFTRIVLAVLVGGALSISGASYQTLFKNSMMTVVSVGICGMIGWIGMVIPHFKYSRRDPFRFWSSRK